MDVIRHKLPCHFLTLHVILGVSNLQKFFACPIAEKYVLTHLRVAVDDKLSVYKGESGYLNSCPCELGRMTDAFCHPNF